MESVIDTIHIECDTWFLCKQLFAFDLRRRRRHQIYRVALRIQEQLSY